MYVIKMYVVICIYVYTFRLHLIYNEKKMYDNNFGNNLF